LTFFPNIRSNTPGAIALQAGSEPFPGYRLLRVRGRGGFAEVWEATSPDGAGVALKFMPSCNGSTTAREVRSMQSLLSLEHPHLVRTHAIWSVPGYIVINMELAEATLLDLMLVYHNELGQPVHPPLLGLYLWQVADALDFLNARQHTRDGRRVGFQHGDVKPNNILIVGNTAKLADYGLATPTYGPTTPCPRQGTREYAAPEVFAGYYSDHSDQFSLAVTYYALRTGTLPFPAINGTPTKSYCRPPANLDGVTPAERRPLLRALAAVPQSRFPSCRDFMSAVLAALGLKAVRNSPDEPWQVIPDDSTPMPPNPARRQAAPPGYAGVDRPSDRPRPAD
jgi:serine/threonine-protein kinase